MDVFGFDIFNVLSFVLPEDGVLHIFLEPGRIYVYTSYNILRSIVHIPGMYTSVYINVNKACIPLRAQI